MRIPGGKRCLPPGRFRAGRVSDDEDGVDALLEVGDDVA
jgi:hypothetical protein